MSIYDRDRMIADLRAAADFLERRPDIPAPPIVSINTFTTGDQLREIARVGTWEKDMYGGYFFLRQSWGSVSIEVNCSRQEVCRRIVTGTRTVPAQPEREEEVVEWECEESLFKEES